MTEPVAQTQITDDIYVSTVGTGADNAPFATRVFGGLHDNFVHRSWTEAQALATHHETVRELREELTDAGTSS